MKPALTLRNVLVFSLVAEGATGLAVIPAPGMVAQLIVGADVTGVGIVYARLLGVALLSLVIACWPGAAGVTPAAVRAMLAYNALAGLYLAYVGIAQPPGGILLWPAVAEHVLVAVLLAIRMRNDPAAAAPARP